MRALVYLFLWRTKWGYELRATGSNPTAAEYGGISIRKQIILAMTISGSLAGMVGINEVLGYRYRYYDGFSDNYGFTGIAVALLGRNHPVGVVVAALLFAVLQRGGIQLTVSPACDQGHRAGSSRHDHSVCRGGSLLSCPFRIRLRRLDADLFTIALISSTIRSSTPLILAALGGLFSERSGVINIALEGMMLAGAFTAAAVTYATGNPWVGLAAAVGAGMLVALVHAVACIRYQADQVVVGTAINILMIGMPAFLSGAFFLSSGSTPQIPNEHLVPRAPIVIAFAFVPITWYVLYQTPFGLRLRSVGENPEAADAAGLNVAKIRYAACCCQERWRELAAPNLSIGQSSLFTRNMTSGRGFIALAALIFGKWRPVQTLLACLLFGFTEAVSIQMQGVAKLPSGDDIPVQFIQMVPYVLTIIVLAGFIGHSRPPRALGRPYEKER